MPAPHTEMGKFAVPILLRRLADALWIPTTALLLALALAQLPLSRMLEALARDAQAGWVAGEHHFPEVLVIDIDDPSLRELTPFFGSWPYKRDTYALLLDYLGEMGARTVVLDLVLSDPRAGDGALRHAIARNGNVVLAASARGDGSADTSLPPALRGMGWDVPAGLGAQTWPAAQLPLADFTQPAPAYARVGMVSAVPDADGVLRRLPLFHHIHGLHLPTLPLAAAFPRGPETGVRLSPDRAVQVGALRLPVDAAGDLRLLYPRNAAAAISVLPFAPVANAMLGVPGQALPPDLIRGRTVFVGSSAFFSDRVDTPAGEMRGVYVVALAHALLMHGLLLQAPVHGWSLLWLLAALLPSLLAGTRPGFSIRGMVWLAVGTAAALYAGQLVLLHTARQESLQLPPLLALLIASALEIARRLHRAKTQQEARIQMLTHDDALTQLPNRLSMQAQLARSIKDARQHHRPLAVLVLDLDRFKTVNDAFGHALGDQLLRAVSQRLQHELPRGDMVARLGGDEFGIILRDTDEAGALHAADHFIGALDLPHRLEGQALHTTASVGISLFPRDGADAATLLRCADTALHHAKREGRNTCRQSTPALNQSAREQLLIENELRQAITGDELVLHYQPQLDLRSGQIVAVEALVRWQHPAQGLLGPDRFIPVAEKSDLILTLDAWVLRTACRQLRIWQQAGLTQLRQVAVNLSARQFDRADLPALIADVLTQAQLGPEHLELEITESLAMRNPEHTIQTLHALRTMGVALTVDDFGTGHSSFSYLKLFPISCVKIDRSFVRDIEIDQHDAAICAATIALAHQLGLDTVAEGVETEGQLRMLTGDQCHKIQGYLVSHPLAAEAVGAFCNSHPVA